MQNTNGDMMRLYSEYVMNRDAFYADFKDCSDFLLKEVVVNDARAFFCAMDGLVDSVMLSHMITEPILESRLHYNSPDEHFEKIKLHTVRALELKEADTFEECAFFLMSGFVVFCLEGCRKVLIIGVQGWNRRATDEPTNEAMVKGAKECFVETLNDNKALLRKRLKTPHLKLKQFLLGEEAKTPVVLAYMENIADAAIVQRTEERLQKSNLQVLFDYGCLVPCLKSEIASCFATVGNTERPDVLASKLMEGRIGILVEGTPFVLYTPYLFSDNFSSLDDYDHPPFYASFIRILKYVSFLISVFLPALYVAIGTYHQEMIPTTLLYIVATSEAATPFPLAAEATMIHILYEIMREAGLRLPKTIGHAVSIIGAIVIGEAMVSAGMIGEPMLVVVALTAIASYVVYPLYESVAVLRLGMIVLVGFTGIYGLMLGLGVVFVNICALHVNGVPYTAPLSPLTPASLGDTLVRRSWRVLAKRRMRIFDLKGVARYDK